MSDFFNETAQSVIGWSDDTFPAKTLKGTILKLEEEILELMEVMPNDSPITDDVRNLVAKEVADVLIVACQITGYMKESLHQILGRPQERDTITFFSRPASCLINTHNWSLPENRVRC